MQAHNVPDSGGDPYPFPRRGRRASVRVGMDPPPLRLLPLVSCALVAAGLHGLTARSLVAQSSDDARWQADSKGHGLQFDPRKFLPKPTSWESRDAGPGPDAGKPAPPEEGEDGRFSAGEGVSERFGAASAPAGEFTSSGEVKRTGSTAARSTDLGPGDGKRGVVVPVEGTIDLGLAPFTRRVVAEAGRAGDVAAIILDVNTFGGRVDAAGHRHAHERLLEVGRTGPVDTR